MNVNFDSILKNADGSWSFAWSGTGPWKVVLYGEVLSASQTDSAYRWVGGEFSDFPPPIEVVLDTELAISERFKPYVVIQWYDEDADRYIVQSSPDGIASWTDVMSFRDDGSWVYTYRSQILLDGRTYYWRVVAESSVGNQSVARKYRVTSVTPPQPVDSKIQINYTSGNVVVSAR